MTNQEAEWNIYQNILYIYNKYGKQQSIQKTIQFMKTPIHKKILIKLPNIISCLEEEDKGLWKEEKWLTNKSINREIN